MNPILAAKLAPPYKLIANYFYMGVFFYILSTIGLPFISSWIDLDFSDSRWAGMFHLNIVGFVMTAIFGATYQLFTVIFETPLFSNKIILVQTFFISIGVSVLSLALIFPDFLWKFIHLGATSLLVGILLFLSNLVISFRGVKEWTLPAKFMVVATIFIFLGVVIGFIMALNISSGIFSINFHNFLLAHITSLVGGAVMNIIIGVSGILIPMFALSHGFSVRSHKISLYSGIIGYSSLILYFLTMINVFAIIGFLFIIFSIVFYLHFIWIIFKKRARKTYDTWSMYVIVSYIWLLSSLILIVLNLLIEADIFKALLFLIIYGFFPFFIIGHMYKIIPFLVWNEKFASLMGKAKVPMLHDMVEPKKWLLQFYLHTVGVFITTISILFSIKFLFIIGGILLSLCAFILLYNLYYIFNFSLKKE